MQSYRLYCDRHSHPGFHVYSHSQGRSMICLKCRKALEPGIGQCCGLAIEWKGDGESERPFCKDCQKETSFEALHDTEVQNYSDSQNFAMRILERIYKKTIVPVLVYAGNSHIYRFTDPLGQKKALKLLQYQKAEDKERFEQEREILIKLQKRFQNPSLCVERLDSYENWLGMVMEYIDGPNLEDWLVKKEKPVSFEEAVRIMSQILNNMALVHAQNIVHRDIKPGNILLRHGKEPLIADFGIAHIMESSSRSAHPLTQTGQILGTPGYMSPEQEKGIACLPKK